MALILSLGAFAGILVPSSHATLSYQSALTSNGGTAVNATADITISGNTMTVTLTDLLTNPNNAANLLNGIKINITGVTGVSDLGANSATIADIAGDGSYTPITAAGATFTTSETWNLAYNNSVINLDALHHQPDYTIIGPDANNNFTSGSGDPGYTGANSSIAGNSSHNPVILGTATFYFTFSGTATENDITGVTFLFGTGSDYSGSTLVPVPEPSTIVAGALLLLPLGMSAIRIMRKQRTV